MSKKSGIEGRWIVSFFWRNNTSWFILVHDFGERIFESSSSRTKHYGEFSLLIYISLILLLSFWLNIKCCTIRSNFFLYMVCLLSFKANKLGSLQRLLAERTYNYILILGRSVNPSFLTRTISVYIFFFILVIHSFYMKLYQFLLTIILISVILIFPVVVVFWFQLIQVVHWLWGKARIENKNKE